MTVGRELSLLSAWAAPLGTASRKSTVLSHFRAVTPACDTIPVPSAVTRKPFSQPVVFTYQVLLDLGPDKDVDTLIVPGQEHFLSLTRRKLKSGVNSQG